MLLFNCCFILSYMDNILWRKPNWFSIIMVASVWHTKWIIYVHIHFVSFTGLCWINGPFNSAKERKKTSQPWYFKISIRNLPALLRFPNKASSWYWTTFLSFTKQELELLILIMPRKGIMKRRSTKKLQLYEPSFLTTTVAYIWKITNK